MDVTHTPTRASDRRPITVAEICRVGRELGMAELSMSAVATALDVTTAALYRHVEGRWGLERLVGESLLAELVLHDDPDHDTAQHLVSFALQLRRFVRTRPGLAAYLELLFPRGEAGTRLLATEVDALTRRGYAVDAAMVLSGAVASVAISLTGAEERRAESTDGTHRDGFTAEERATNTRLGTDPRFAAATALPRVSTREYVDLLIAAAVRGLAEVAPADRPVDEVVAALRAAVA